eukprot:SAG31_NODE_21901_length_538_cov_0.897494_1_plen_109_part_01
MIKHDNTGGNAAWFLDRVVIATDGQESIFPCYKWLDDKDGEYLERTLFPGTATEPELAEYTVSVFTGAQRGAGTDANVKIKINGNNSVSDELPLESGANDFEPAKKYPS